MRVPLLDLPAQHRPFRAALDAALARVIDSGHFILGPEVEACEREVAAYAGQAYGVGMSSGTDALLAALMALGIGPGDEVVTTPLSFFATAAAVSRVGARPVFADLGEGFHIDPEAALAKVTAKTRLLLPVSLFGERADLGRLAASGLPLVEDGAQVLGAPSIGKDARCVTLSFFPSKNLGALGDAGMVLTDDEALADRLRMTRAHGARPKYHHHFVGGNFRLDALQAAVIRVKLEHLDAWNAARRRNADRYRALLGDVDAITLPADSPGHIYHQFVVRVAGPAAERASRREKLRAYLAEAGVETEVYYPVPLHLQACFADLGYRAGDFPRAEAATREAFALPIHPELNDAQLDHVAATVRQFVRDRWA